MTLHRTGNPLTFLPRLGADRSAEEKGQSRATPILIPFSRNKEQHIETLENCIRFAFHGLRRGSDKDDDCLDGD